MGLKKNDEGAVAVEAALVLPVLFAAIFMLIGFGIVLNADQTLTHSAHEGARYASLGQDQTVVQQRVEATVGSLVVLTDPVDSPGCVLVDGNSVATVTVKGTVNAIFFSLPLSATGVEKCA